MMHSGSRRLEFPGAAALALGALCAFSLTAVAADASVSAAIQARLKSVSSVTNVVEIERPPDSTVYSLAVVTGDAVRLSHAPAETVVIVDVDDSLHPTRITRIQEVSVPVGAYERILVMSGSFVVLFLFAMGATGGRPLRFLIGLDNRYSNSQCQIVLWFGTLAVIYVSAVVLRLIHFQWSLIGGIGITANVIALTGLSAVSFGGAKVITTQKTTPNVQPGVAPNIPSQMLRPLKTRAPRPHLLTDLFMNDRGDADFGDFQMILVTLAAVGVYGASCFVFLGNLWPEQSILLPDIDTTLLSAFGVGQGAYLVKKAAMNPGEG